MKIFRGYIPVRSEGAKAKTPIPYTNPRTGTLVKNRKGLGDEEWLTLEEARGYSGYAGLLTGEAVVIDVDTEKESLLLFGMVKDLKLKCLVKRTTRGRHFYFRKPRSLPLGVGGSKIHALVRVGLEVDFLFAVDDPDPERAKEKYIVLKLGGRERETEYEADEIGELPYWLFPMPRGTGVRFAEVSSGGRNNELLTYQIKLANELRDDSRIRETIRLINKYVLPEPLSDDEVETLARPEAVRGARTIADEGRGVTNTALTEFLDGKKIKYDEYAEYLIRKLHVKKINGTLYVYKNGIYLPNYKESNHIAYHIAKNDFRNRTNGTHNEIMAAISRNIDGDASPAPERLLPFRNGYVDVDSFDPITGSFRLEKHNPEVVFTQMIPWDYNPAAPEKPWRDLFLDWAAGRADVAQVMIEAVGISLFRSTKGFDPKFFILTGGRSNGKTTYLKFLEKLLGPENVGSVPPQSFEERFSLAYLENKLANIVNDLDEGSVDRAGKLKDLVDGSPLTVERKGEHPFTLRAYCTNIFACNNIPRIKDDSLATRKRLAIIPFDVEYSKDKANRNLVEEMATEEGMSGLANYALYALRGVLNRKCITLSPTVEGLTDRFASVSSSIVSFSEECAETGYDFEGKATKDVYAKYTDHCTECGFTAFSLINFSRKLCKIAKLETVQIRDGYVRRQIYRKQCQECQSIKKDL